FWFVWKFCRNQFTSRTRYGRASRNDSDCFDQIIFERHAGKERRRNPEYVVACRVPARAFDVDLLFHQSVPDFVYRSDCAGEQAFKRENQRVVPGRSQYEFPEKCRSGKGSPHQFDEQRPARSCVLWRTRDAKRKSRLPALTQLQGPVCFAAICPQKFRQKYDL